MAHLQAFYNLYGYRIETSHSILYESGNHACDSLTLVDPRCELASPLSQIKRFAALTLRERAEWYRDNYPREEVTVAAPEYDQDEETRIARHRGDDDLASDLERLRAL